MNSIDSFLLAHPAAIVAAFAFVWIVKACLDWRSFRREVREEKRKGSRGIDR